MKTKSFIVALVIVCVVVVAGAIVYLGRQKTSPPATSIVQSSPDQLQSQTISSLPKQESQPAISQNAAAPAQTPIAAPAVNETKPVDSTNAINRAVDALLSAKSAGEKHDLFQQLLKDGQLDAAMAELQQRMMDNPTNAEIPTTLGEAQLNKLRAIKDAGGDPNEMGILAMQADQSFNAALKIDPQNWEANFVKAASMYYWPADPARDADVVQRLSGLIDQQETMSPNPAFAQTYVVLGNEFQKLGQPDKAAATWQLGLTKFPNDPTLLKKISGQ
jgi:tetratricopeptide (TPR) repeat protein